jgi:hypothetical protein
MSLLKRLPIRYTGCLHGVQLVNFTVERREVEPLVPWKLRIRDVGEGRALISLVNVELRGMHPHFLPEALHFGYRHVASGCCWTTLPTTGDMRRVSSSSVRLPTNL